jgi:hypothetical protein
MAGRSLWVPLPHGRGSDFGSAPSRSLLGFEPREFTGVPRVFKRGFDTPNPDMGLVALPYSRGSV